MQNVGLTVKRRLAAVLCADVAGYSRLMRRDSQGTLRMLTSHRAVMDRQIAQHGGRIANTAGDSVVAEFPSVIDAVRCALSVQERIAAANEGCPEDHRVAFRMGLHVDEAIVRDGDLFGDGVNVAARMQSLASPGAICLSGTAHEFIRRALPVPVVELGPQAVKNIDEPITAFLISPPQHQASTQLPPVHRTEFYLARRFQEICVGELKTITDPVNLIPIDLAALASLMDLPDISSPHLAERLGIDLPRTAAILKRLQKLRYVGSSKASGKHTWRLTTDGEAFFLSVRPAIIESLSRILTPLTQDDRKTLRDLLSRIIRFHSVQCEDRERLSVKSGSEAFADQGLP